MELERISLNTMTTKKELKEKILALMLHGSHEADRELMLLEIISEYPYLNNSNDRQKFRILYDKYRVHNY